MDTIRLNVQNISQLPTRMYSQTNEDLDALFENFNFDNKEVLSVLASSDQLLSSYYYGAKNVDAFDRNIRTLYYYYLRKWLITYNNQVYPNFCSKNNNYVEMIEKIECENMHESYAKTFWLNILTRNFYEMDYFEYSPYTQKMKYEQDYDFIRNVFNRNFSFLFLDMFRKVSLDKKYDLIILSNMLEYLRGNKESLVIVKNNLENLLNDNGQVICSCIINNHDKPHFLLEKNILTMDNLIYEGHYEYYEPLLGKLSESGYSYRLIKK